MDDQRTDLVGADIAFDRDARNILQLIERHSGEWNWYQLANRDARIELAVTGRLMKIIRSLTASGYVSEIEGPNRGQPNYVITDLGREAIGRE